MEHGEWGEVHHPGLPYCPLTFSTLCSISPPHTTTGGVAVRSKTVVNPGDGFLPDTSLVLHSIFEVYLRRGGRGGKKKGCEEPSPLSIPQTIPALAESIDHFSVDAANELIVSRDVDSVKTSPCPPPLSASGVFVIARGVEGGEGVNWALCGANGRKSQLNVAVVL
ncbi:hypothetical protein CEXT_126391 [Caerostris extrusa]|uniref:Uncharacterized protein n=1 Tax=Caerostris extrusa TaxID=172846 RepID=A0AAV4XFM3_CAEEX|nr:hypothetical protein CEXT_126391 [Caerostris extrusa]